MGRAEIIEVLQGDILRLQGFKSFGRPESDLGLGLLNDAFPGGAFPLGAVHEFLSPKPEDLSATSGFVTGLLSSIMGTNGVAIWISASRKVFAPALRMFGVQPDRIIFIDLQKEKDAAWSMEEALKCGALSAVVGEMNEISFTASRRLQLAVEQCSTTGFILRRNCRKLNTTACLSRWRISSQPSLPVEDLPGIGFPRWKVELLRMRNGRTGTWDVSWMKGRFEVSPDYSTTKIPTQSQSLPLHRQKDTLDKTG